MNTVLLAGASQVVAHRAILQLLAARPYRWSIPRRLSREPGLWDFEPRPTPILPRGHAMLQAAEAIFSQIRRPGK